MSIDANRTLYTIEEKTELADISWNMIYADEKRCRELRKRQDEIVAMGRQRYEANAAYKALAAARAH